MMMILDLNMKISTWNVERLRHKQHLSDITSACENTDADILILTETDEQIKLSYKNCILSSPLDRPSYRKTERRIAIYTNYEIASVNPTFDSNTSLCADVVTEYGVLTVYGTIIGIYGNRHPSFIENLKKQTADFARLCSEKKHICICGDFNCSFSDNYYFTHEGRNLLLQSFADNNIRLLTETAPECIDHIAVSSDFLNSANIEIEEWNNDKRLSDHKGISATMHL